MIIDLENLERLATIIESISTETRTSLIAMEYSLEEIKQREALFARISTAAKMTHNYLDYYVNVYEGSDPVLFLQEIEATLPQTEKEGVATYKDLLAYTGEL